MSCGPGPGPGPGIIIPTHLVVYCYTHLYRRHT